MALEPVQLGNTTLQYSEQPRGDTYRNIGSSWFNSGEIAKEDWKRQEQSADNALIRDLYYMSAANEFTASQKELERNFNATEAQKQRDWQERLSNTSYQRAVEDLKTAGLNPVLAYSNGGSSTPSGSTASSSGASSSGGRTSGSGSGSRVNSDPLSALTSTLLKVFAGIVTQKPELVVSGVLDQIVDHGNGSSTRVRSYEYGRRK